jgi:hypothetical protein
VQFDVEADLRRHLAIPQTRDRRYNIKLHHYRHAGPLSVITNQRRLRLHGSRAWSLDV